VRKYGLTIDDLLAAEVVTADGSCPHVDADSHPDLFWAIRGGGGNFGVATRFKLRLHEVERVYGGMLFIPASPDAIVALVEETLSAPHEFSAMVNVMKAPPMPFIPDEFHGRPVVMVLLAHCGDIQEGQEIVDRLRKIATPLADMARPMPYLEVYPPEEEGFHPVAAIRTMFTESIDRDAAVSILEHLEASSAFLPVAHLRALGGAMARVPADATAFAHRDRKLLANVFALYEGPEQKEEHEAWVADLSADIGGAPGAYASFLGEDGTERIREAYPGPTWDRLVEAKRRYDPDNVFRWNHNIRTAAPRARSAATRIGRVRGEERSNRREEKP
jgi:FAD/FMN-containing dehydrogenase